MVVEKRDEHIKGQLIIKPGKKYGQITGSFEYEYDVPNKGISPDPKEHFIVMGIPVKRNSETREGTFAVIQNNKAIALLKYEVYYSCVREFESSKAQLCLFEFNPNERFSISSIDHFFEDGTYTHSQIHPDSSFFKEVKLSSGLSLYPYPNYAKVIEARNEAREKLKIEFYKKAEEAEKEYKKQQRLTQSINVLVDDFKIPEIIKKELKSSDYSLINDLIGKYL